MTELLIRVDENSCPIHSVRVESVLLSHGNAVSEPHFQLVGGGACFRVDKCALTFEDGPLWNQEIVKLVGALQRVVPSEES